MGLTSELEEGPDFFVFEDVDLGGEPVEVT